MIPLVIIGASSLSDSVVEIVKAEKKYRIICLLDDDLTLGNSINGILINGGIKDLTTISYSNHNLHVIIAVGDPVTRHNIFCRINQIPDLKIASVIHPNSTIMSSVKLGVGNIVFPGVVVSANSNIGNFCILNANCVVSARSNIKDFASLSPNVSLGSEVEIGEKAFLGIGSAVAQGIKIGDNCKIGALSFISSEVLNGTTVVGIPARALTR